jgi:hypothetical protein
MEQKTVESIEKAIRNTRQQLMDADDKGEPTQQYTDSIIELKRELAELKGVSKEVYASSQSLIVSPCCHLSHISHHLCHSVRYSTK